MSIPRSTSRTNIPISMDRVFVLESLDSTFFSGAISNFGSSESGSSIPSNIPLEWSSAIPVEWSSAIPVEWSSAETVGGKSRSTLIISASSL